jgi:nitroreductase
MNETIRTIHSLRSIHGNFSPQDISDQDLEQIVAAAVKAANASARQSYAIIVLDDRDVMRELIGYEGSRALVFCVDFMRIRMTGERLGYMYDGTGIINFITGTVDASLAVQNAVVAAKSLGIDSLITNGLHRNNLDTVYKSLNLPEEACFPIITVVLGFPNKEPAHPKGRLSPEFVTHCGRCSLPEGRTLDRIIAEHDDTERHIGLGDFWDEKGFRRYLDWYFSKWEPMWVGTRPVEGKIKEFQERLIRSGFWWE